MTSQDQISHLLWLLDDKITNGDRTIKPWTINRVFFIEKYFMTIHVDTENHDFSCFPLPVATLFFIYIIIVISMNYSHINW